MGIYNHREIALKLIHHDVNYCSRARMVSLFVFSKADEIVCCFVFSRQGRQEFLRGCWGWGCYSENRKHNNEKNDIFSSLIDTDFHKG